MISIIICSTNCEDLKRIKKNIFETIGVSYEIIVIDNRNNKYWLTRAYNIASSKCKYDYFCFLHQDIRFLTENWGILLIDHFSDENVGLIGIAGTQYKSIIPSSWSVFPEWRTINVMQHHKFSEKNGFLHQENVCGKNYLEVIAIDGVFMATKRKIIEEFKFDEIQLKKFHGYDIDFSLQISKNYSIRVVHDILLEHFSEGNQNREWMDSAIAVSDKWRRVLPKGVLQLSKKDERIFHTKALSVFTSQIIQLNYPFLEQLKMVSRYGFFYYPSFFLVKAVLKNILRLFHSFIYRGIRLKFNVLQ